MDTKAAFEKWWVSKPRKFTICEADLQKELQWESWRDSRAVIEIELPQRQSICAAGYGDGYFVPSNAGEGLEYDEVVEAITSHGIRIKGKTE